MKLLTTSEAAEVLRICPSSVRALCDEKKLKCIRHNRRGKRLIPEQAIESYLSTLTDSVETYSPVAVVFDDVDRRMKERSERIRRVK